MALQLTKEQAQRFKKLSEKSRQSYRGRDRIDFETVSKVEEMLANGMRYRDIVKEACVSTTTITKIKRGGYDDR